MGTARSAEYQNVEHPECQTGLTRRVRVRVTVTVSVRVKPVPHSGIWHAGLYLY